VLIQVKAFGLDQVVAVMGGMGRTFDGGHAEYTCGPARQVIAFSIAPAGNNRFPEGATS